MNGAPEFKQTTDKDKNAVLDLTMDQPCGCRTFRMVQCNRSVALHHDVLFTPTKTKTVIVEKAMRQKGVRAIGCGTYLQDDWKLMKTYVSKGGYFSCWSS